MSRGGSRYGAGRPGWRRKCEQSLALDIRRLHRMRRLVPGMNFSWQWTTNYGDKAGSVMVNVERDIVRLQYVWTPYGHDAQSVTCSLFIQRTRCNYGGQRPWFRCPQCGRRCAVVYFGARGGRYACRKCLNLAYISETEDRMGRLWRKQGKLEARLGEDGAKPKGMHWKTAERIWERLDEIEERKDGLIYAYIARCPELL